MSKIKIKTVQVIESELDFCQVEFNEPIQEIKDLAEYFDYESYFKAELKGSVDSNVAHFGVQYPIGKCLYASAFQNLDLPCVIYEDKMNGVSYVIVSSQVYFILQCIHQGVNPSLILTYRNNHLTETGKLARKLYNKVVFQDKKTGGDIKKIVGSIINNSTTSDGSVGQVLKDLDKLGVWIKNKDN